MKNTSDCAAPAGEWVSGNIFIRPVRLAHTGDVIDGHTHTFDHTTIVIHGLVHVVATCDEGCHREGEFAAGSHFLTKATWRHTITALSDDVEVWCVYSHRTPQGEVVQESTGWPEAYR